MAEKEPKRGAGRPKGAKGKRVIAGNDTAFRVAKVIDAGVTPLEFLLSVMRDGEQPIEFRLEAAKAAAPYVHRKLPQAIEVETKTPIAVQIVTPLTAALSHGDADANHGG